MNPSSPSNEPEHRGPWWTHPYMIYVCLTALLFGFLVLMAWLAIENDWLPKR